MAENQFPSTVDALFKGMDNFITTKTAHISKCKEKQSAKPIDNNDMFCCRV